jgi:hypothetical protein
MVDGSGVQQTGRKVSVIATIKLQPKVKFPVGTLARWQN